MAEKSEAPKPHFTIWPEYGQTFLWINTEGTHKLTGGQYSKAAAALERGISKRLMTRLTEWQLVYERNAFQSTEHNGRRPYDWNGFHRLGIYLAVQLKEELGDRARVFYEKPDEDPNSHLNTRREVLIDGQLVEAE
jgi:hypothetical protein